MEVNQFVEIAGRNNPDVRQTSRGNYSSLPGPARRLLRSIKLLRSAGIYAYPVPRVRSTAEDLFGLLPADWENASGVLAASGLVRLSISPAGDPLAFELVPGISIEQVVSDYPKADIDIADDWPRLQDSLMQRQDVDALNLLGNSFNKRGRGDSHINLKRAEDCFRAALCICTQEYTPKMWASVQNNLGVVLRKQALETVGADRMSLLDQAMEAYRSALQVYTLEHTPKVWASVQNNLGVALRQQAVQVEGEQRANLLREAIEAYQAMLTVYTQRLAPNTWAMAQFNLALMHLQRLGALEGNAEMTCGVLYNAKRCVTAALSVFTREVHPVRHREAEELYNQITEIQQAISCSYEEGSGDDYHQHSRP